MSTEAWASAKHVLFTQLPEMWEQFSSIFPDITADDIFTAAQKVAEIAKLCFVGEERYRDTSWTHHYEVQPLLWFTLDDLETMNTDEKIARVLLSLSLFTIAVNPFFGPKGRLKNLAFLTHQLLQSYITALIVLESQCREFREKEFKLKTDKIDELTAQLALIKTLKEKITKLTSQLETATTLTKELKARNEESKQQVNRLEGIVNGVTNALENHSLDQNFLVAALMSYRGMVDNLHVVLQLAASSQVNATTLQLLTNTIRGNLQNTGELLNVLQPVTLALENGGSGPTTAQPLMLEDTVQTGQ